MIFLRRRRLLMWLIRAYIKKWKSIIFIFFGLGLLVFFIFYLLFSYISPILSLGQGETIGILGTYNFNNLPIEILGNISYGLTDIDKNGKPKPGAASSWSVDSSGKKYTFYLKDNLHFTDGSKLSSKEVNYNFEDVEIQKSDKNTVIFKLKENYSPFLVTVSRPILKNKFIGLGNYEVKSIDLNGDFVNSIALQGTKKPFEKKLYQFYPTEDSLKTALVLGEISKTSDISDLSFKNSSLKSFSNYKISQSVNYKSLATLFYNTQDKVLSDKRLRQALTYAIPNGFTQGVRNRTPYPPTLWTNREDSFSYEQDFDHAKLLLASSLASGSANINLKIKALPKYKNTAEKIKNSWNKIGVSSNVEVVDTLPSNFQIFVGEFYMSKDPDQYTLWHSGQPNNVTGYKNLRIDKLLEDGRQTIDLDKREKIYSDFQKYLLDDSPAAFLFFPYNYTLTKIKH